MNARNKPYSGWLKMAVSYPITILSWPANIGISEDLQAGLPGSVGVKRNKGITRCTVVACAPLSLKVESVV
jgi:hypothetical protein